MYSPKIPERLISALYRLARDRGQPMTRLVAEAVEQLLASEGAWIEPFEPRQDAPEDGRPGRAYAANGRASTPPGQPPPPAAHALADRSWSARQEPRRRTGAVWTDDEDATLLAIADMAPRVIADRMERSWDACRRRLRYLRAGARPAENGTNTDVQRRSRQ